MAVALAAQQPSSTPSDASPDPTNPVNPPGALNPAPPAPPPPAKDEPAELEGFVISDSTGQPLRRAHVVLNALENGKTSTGAEADDEGHFLLSGIPKGIYSLSAERDGFLTNSQPLSGGLRMPPAFRLESGQKITDLSFRLRPWAVISGRVRYSDGDFGVGVRVQMYRTDHIRGRNAYSLAATAVANDRGEYRIYGLAPGAYLMAASYEPPANANYREQPMRDAQGRELPAMGYMLTFYPNTELMSQAVPVRLNYGEELAGIDLYVRQARKLKLRGRVIDGVTGTVLTSANVTLERVDATGNGMLPANATVNFDREGNFEIPSVSPGSYGVFVRAAGDSSGSAILTGHTLLVVGTDDVDGIDLIANPAAAWRGAIVTEGPGAFMPSSSLRVTLEPRTVDAPPCNASPVGSQESGALEISCLVERDETYDVYADNLPADFYLSAVRVGGTDVKAIGLPGNIVSAAPFEVVLDSRGGRVSGAVAGADNVLWGGATVMLIPDPAQRRLQDYRFVSADANGRFIFHGVAPGSYILVAWLDETPCDVYDPDGLDRCRAAGMNVTVSAGTEQNLLLTAHALAQ